MLITGYANSVYVPNPGVSFVLSENDDFFVEYGFAQKKVIDFATLTRIIATILNKNESFIGNSLDPDKTSQRAGYMDFVDTKLQVFDNLSEIQVEIEDGVTMVWIKWTLNDEDNWPLFMSFTGDVLVQWVERPEKVDVRR